MFITIQTSLRFRSPYSCSYDSLAVTQQPPSELITHQQQLFARGHIRGYSGGVMGISPSLNQLGNTPRRSIDADSNMPDDDTSYDSTSQISLDFEIVKQQQHQLQKGFYLDPNINQQGTISSLNALKQQQYAQQQDMASFETIKRVLFNGNGGLSSNNSAAGGQTSSQHRTSGASSSGGRQPQIVTVKTNNKFNCKFNFLL